MMMTTTTAAGKQIAQENASLSMMKKQQIAALNQLKHFSMT